MSHGSGQLVVAYHGCDRATVDALVSGSLKELDQSDNPYDWLGKGTYFFQDDWRRALMFAQASAESPTRKFTARPIINPSVVGAILRLSSVLDMSTQEGIDAFRISYESLLLADIPLKKNRKSKPEDIDVILRGLDRQVFTNLHQMLIDQGIPPVDAVRGAFPQGNPVAPTSAIFANSHVQIALRNPSCVLGYFRVPEIVATEI